MSIQAVTWALEHAPDVPANLVSTLIGLANHAGRDGRGSYPSNETLATYTRKSVRQVQRDVDRLTDLGLIRPGNPAFVAHIRPDQRPQVWDLAMERERGDTYVTPFESHGVTPVTERGDTGDVNGVTPMSPEPSLGTKGKNQNISDADASGNDAAAPPPDDPPQDPQCEDEDLFASWPEDQLPLHNSRSRSNGTTRRGDYPRPAGSSEHTAGDHETVGGAVTARTVTAVWVEAFRETRPGVRETRSQRGQVSREARELLEAGNDPQRVLQVAKVAAIHGWSTLKRQFALETAPAGNGRHTNGWKPDRNPTDPHAYEGPLR